MLKTLNSSNNKSTEKNVNYMPLKQYFCGSLYSLEKKGLSLFGIPQVVQVLTMEERRTDNHFFFNFSTGGNGKIS